MFLRAQTAGSMTFMCLDFSNLNYKKTKKHCMLTLQIIQLKKLKEIKNEETHLSTYDKKLMNICTIPFSTIILIAGSRCRVTTLRHDFSASKIMLGSFDSMPMTILSKLMATSSRSSFLGVCFKLMRTLNSSWKEFLFVYIQIKYFFNILTFALKIWICTHFNSPAGFFLTF